MQPKGLPLLLSTYALRGSGGVGPNAEVVLRLSKRGCVDLRTRGRGIKKAGKSAYVLDGSPQGMFTTNMPQDAELSKFDVTYIISSRPTWGSWTIPRHWNASSWIACIERIRHA